MTIPTDPFEKYVCTTSIGSTQADDLGVRDDTKNEAMDLDGDAMDLDGDRVIHLPEAMDSEFFGSLFFQPEDTSARLLANDPRLNTVFRKTLIEKPQEELIANKMARIAAKLYPTDELPSWTAQVSLSPAPLSLFEMVKQDRRDLLEQQKNMTPAEWLAVRTTIGDSLLHLAIREGLYEMAAELVKCCPAFLLAKNSQNQFALDFLPHNPEKIETINALLLPYANLEGRALSPQVAVWRQLVPLCYLENSFWAMQFAEQQRALLSNLDPREISQEPTHYHPLKICAQLGKKELAEQLLTVCCTENIMTLWVCISGAAALVPLLGIRSNQTSLSQLPLYVREHPTCKKMFFLYPEISVSTHEVTIAFLFEYGMEDLAVRRANSNRFTCLRLAPGSLHTERLWKERFADHPADELQEISKFLEADSFPISSSGLSFVVKRLKQILTEETAKGCKTDNILPIVLQAQDRDLAVLFFSAYKRDLHFVEWFSALVKIMLDAHHVGEPQIAWFIELAGIAEKYISLYIRPAMLVSMVESPKECALPIVVWLRKTHSEQFDRVLHEQMIDPNYPIFDPQVQPTPFLRSLRRYLVNPNPVSQNMLDFLASDLDWRKMGKLVKFGKSKSTPLTTFTLRHFALLYSDRHVLNLIGEQSWSLRDLKEILSLGDHLQGGFLKLASNMWLRCFCLKWSRM